MDGDTQKTYIAPQVFDYGTIAQLTRQGGGPKQSDIQDLFMGNEGEGLPPGKIAGTEDAFSADSMS